MCIVLLSSMTLQSATKLLRKCHLKKWNILEKNIAQKGRSLFPDLGHKKSTSFCLSHPHKTPGGTPTIQPGHGTNRFSTFYKVTLGIALTLQFSYSYLKHRMYKLHTHINSATTMEYQLNCSRRGLLDYNDIN